MEEVNAIHGGSKVNLKPGTIGLLETMEKKCKEDDIVEGMKKCKKLKEKVLPGIYKEDLKEYESSDDNMLRSIAVYYSKGVMGEDKYRKVYKATSYKKVIGKKRAERIRVASCPSPRLVPYHRLMAYIKSIDVGKLHSVCDNLCHGLDDCEKVNGCYGDVEHLRLSLAKFYLNHSKYNLLSFDEPNTSCRVEMVLHVGGDGAPFRRDDSARSWLVSILNIGQRCVK